MDTFENVLLFSDLIKKGTGTNCLCQIGSIIIRLYNSLTAFSQSFFELFPKIMFDVLSKTGRQMALLSNVQNRNQTV